MSRKYFSKIIIASLFVLGGRNLAFSQGWHQPDRLVQKVYDNLKGTLRWQGNLSYPALLEGRIGVPAKFLEEHNVILVNTLFLGQLKAKFPELDQYKAALGVLIGHELYHFQEASQHTGSMLVIPPSERNWAEFSAQMIVELKSDYYGAFIAYSAGLRVQNILEPFFMLSIQETKNDSTYPPREVRVKLGYGLVTMINRQIDLFELGNLLSLVDEYELAIECQREVAKVYRSRDLLNNLSVNYMRLAQKWGGINNFLYPYAQDAGFLLQQDVRVSTKIDLEKRDRALKMAWQAMEEASSHEAFYQPLLLNRACFFLLINKPMMVLRELKENLATIGEVRPRRNDIYYHRQLILALTIRQLGEKEKAEKRLKEIILYSSSENLKSLAQKNLSKMSYQPITRSQWPPCEPPFRWKPSSSKRQILLNDLQAYSQGTEDKTSFYIPGRWQFSRNRLAIKTSCGILKGSLEKEVRSIYGPPKGSYTWFRNYAYIYPENEMIFWFAPNNEVLFWYRYRSL